MENWTKKNALWMVLYAVLYALTTAIICVTGAIHPILFVGYQITAGILITGIVICAFDRVKAPGAAICLGAGMLLLLVIIGDAVAWHVIPVILIAIRDFSLIAIGKLGGLKLLEKAFSTDDYSEEDLKYVARVLQQMSAKTIWRTFESANNYIMPDRIHTDCKHVEYWFSKAEEKDRKWDIAYVKETLPGIHFRRYKNVGHGGLAALAPKKLAKVLDQLISGTGKDG